MGVGVYGELGGEEEDEEEVEGVEVPGPPGGGCVLLRRDLRRVDVEGEVLPASGGEDAGPVPVWMGGCSGRRQLVCGQKARRGGRGGRRARAGGVLTARMRDVTMVWNQEDV